MRAEPTNNCTAGADICHSTMFTLLLDLSVISQGFPNSLWLFTPSAFR